MARSDAWHTFPALRAVVRHRHAVQRSFHVDVCVGLGLGDASTNDQKAVSCHWQRKSTSQRHPFRIAASVKMHQMLKPSSSTRLGSNASPALSLTDALGNPNSKGVSDAAQWWAKVKLVEEVGHDVIYTLWPSVHGTSDEVLRAPPLVRLYWLLSVKITSTVGCKCPVWRRIATIEWWFAGAECASPQGSPLASRAGCPQILVALFYARST
ncbi:uncharacterized protein B0H18DRAFT_960968 [Fomitopsis serialis]|uniref:uncharacterized protein n=1 Tax=Fomitopsis serialis TaxID=139415 RepID=UPI002007AF2E|nr:uncharacterized protein B0H18DRAFT_960968 [Neoantrodia serialis]KAH9912542.1 hypothetical protein B0H18DRAFT_960968 [Neoantrodia serialis]